MALCNHFIFESNWKIITIGQLVFNIIAVLIYSHFYVPAAGNSFVCAIIIGIVISAADVKRSIYSLLIVIIAAMTIEIYFERVKQHVFNELLEYSGRVEQTAQTKEVFFAGVSHDIRNLLQSILGSVELLQIQGGENPTTQSGLLDIVKGGCDVLLNIVSHILDATKIEAGKMDIVAVPASLNENVGKIFRVLEDRVKAKGIELRYVEQAGFPPCLLFDPARLQQVILNLVSNSIKFTQKGSVTVCTSWIPLAEVDRDITMKLQFSLSGWKSLLSPMLEVDDDQAEMRKRLRATETHSFVPSRRDGSRDCSSAGVQSARPSSNSPDIDIVPFGRRRRFGSLGQAGSDATKKGLVKIEVIDSGIGINKEAAKGLFRPFRQADSTISQYDRVRNIG